MNGLPAPDLYLTRGQTYTFVVETGLGSIDSLPFHPFYITSDREGGFQTKSDYEKQVSFKNFNSMMKYSIIAERLTCSIPAIPAERIKKETKNPNF